MWWEIIIYIFAVYTIYQIDNRIKHLEAIQQGKGNSHYFIIDATEAITKHKKFGVLTGIESAIEGKEYKDWSKNDKDKWQKYYIKIKDKFNKARVALTYIDSENAYYVNNFIDNPYFCFREFNTNIVYSAIVLGDKDGFETRLEFRLYERYVKLANGKRECRLVPSLMYSEGIMSGEHEFNILCEYPHFNEALNDKSFEELGFNIKRYGNDGQSFTNDFGETDYIPFSIEYSKNNVSINYYH